MTPLLRFVLIAIATFGCKPSETQGHRSSASLMPSASSGASDSISDHISHSTDRVTIDTGASAEPNDWLIVPGVRVGPVTARFTEADLKRVFGTEVVVRDSVYWFEDQYRPGSILFPGDSIRRIAIVWKDQERRSNPIQIQLEGRRSMWHTTDRISLGTTLEELERLNGKPFRITSGNHDYAGLAWSWENGVLDSALERVELRLRPYIESKEQHPLSTDSAARAARASVHLLNLYFPD